MNDETLSYEDRHYRVAGEPCPECGGATWLYQNGHQHAGTWECKNEDCGASDSCPHDELRTETFENDTLDSRGEHTTYETVGWVCEACECPVDGYEPEEPDDDRYED